MNTIKSNKRLNNMNAYLVTFKPNEIRPNGTEVSVFGMNSNDAVCRAKDHLLPGINWEEESVKQL